MFGPTNLKARPFISAEFDYPHEFKAPPANQVSCSDWLYMSLQDDRIEKIYAMRVLPLHDFIAFKLKYRDEDMPCSEIISKPEFCLLKMIWDCGNVGFNKGILHYLMHSKHCAHQYMHKEHFPQNGKISNEWYYSTIVMGYV